MTAATPIFLFTIVPATPGIASFSIAIQLNPGPSLRLFFRIATHSAVAIAETLTKDTMQKVKFFKSIESELTALEKEINAWIKTTGAKVISIHGNIAPQTAVSQAPMGTFSSSDVLIVIHYETTDAS